MCLVRGDLRAGRIEAALELGAHGLEGLCGRAQVGERGGQDGGLLGVDRAPLDGLLLARLDRALHLRQQLLALHIAHASAFSYKYTSIGTAGEQYMYNSVDW